MGNLMEGWTSLGCDIFMCSSGTSLTIKVLLVSCFGMTSRNSPTPTVSVNLMVWWEGAGSTAAP